MFVCGGLLVKYSSANSMPVSLTTSTVVVSTVPRTKGTDFTFSVNPGDAGSPPTVY